MTNNSASGKSVTTHEVVATAMTATLKHTADFNTSNKLLRVGGQSSSAALDHLKCSTGIEQQRTRASTKLILILDVIMCNAVISDQN